MDFANLHGRLVAHLRKRVRSGEWTERGLARLTGVSQPHLHNVLKGVRLLSSDTADQLLRHLRIDLFDLLQEPGDETPGSVLVPKAEGFLGPGHPFPDLENTSERAPIWWPFPAALCQPVLVCLAADPGLYGLFGAGDFVLLDCAEHKRRHPDAQAYYALHPGPEGLVRRIRCHEPLYASDYVLPLDRNILEIVKAKVIWIGRNLEPPRFAARSSEETGREY